MRVAWWCVIAHGTSAPSSAGSNVSCTSTGPCSAGCMVTRMAGATPSGDLQGNNSMLFFDEKTFGKHSFRTQKYLQVVGQKCKFFVYESY